MNAAKEYLRQIQRLENQIRHLDAEILDVRSRLYGHGLTYDRDRVQTSPSDPMAETFARIDQLEREQLAMIEELKLRRTKIICQIDQLPKRYAGILHLRYVKGMKLDRIARMMQYSHDRTRHLHGEALNEFMDKFGEEVEAWLKDHSG